MKFTSAVIILELLIYEILSGVYINVIGTISLGDLMVIFLVPLFLIKNKLRIFKDDIYKKFAIIYLVYLITQIISEIIVGNELANSLRGFSTTIVSFLTVSYFYLRFEKIEKWIQLVFLLEAIKLVLFISSEDVSGYVADSVDIEDAGFFKFKLVPIIINIVLILTYYLLAARLRRLTVIVLLATTLFFIAFGARSSSFIFFLSALFMLNKKWFLLYRSKIYLILLLFLITLYIIYVTWVYVSINSTKIIANNDQFFRMNNPYNPLELLVQGRTEFFVGLYAFSENWIWGFGAWVPDKNFKYFSLITVYKNLILSTSAEAYLMESSQYIPSHSVLVGAAVNNGIFSLFSMISLFLFFINIFRRLFWVLIASPYFIILIHVFFQIMWNMLFSPITHLRLSLPLLFAMLLFLYKKNYKNNYN